MRWHIANTIWRKFVKLTVNWNICLWNPNDSVYGKPATRGLGGTNWSDRGWIRLNMWIMAAMPLYHLIPRRVFKSSTEDSYSIVTVRRVFHKARPPYGVHSDHLPLGGQGPEATLHMMVMKWKWKCVVMYHIIDVNKCNRLGWQRKFECHVEMFVRQALMEQVQPNIWLMNKLGCTSQKLHLLHSICCWFFWHHNFWLLDKLTSGKVCRSSCTTNSITIEEFKNISLMDFTRLHHLEK